MFRFKLLLFFTLYSFLYEAESARILGVFPMPSISHQVVFRALTHELAKRGHELVIITPNPALPKERPPDNITEIDTGHSYTILKERLELMQGDMKRGVTLDIDVVLNYFMELLIDLNSSMFGNQQVKKLMEDQEQKFDLVIAEAFTSFPLVFAKIFNAKVIHFSSFYGLPDNYDAMGAVSRHPVLYPNIYRSKFNNLSYFEKLREVYYELLLYNMAIKSEKLENVLLKTEFGPNAPTVTELKENIVLTFLNAHPIMDNNRPVPPGVVYLGALHLQSVKELPTDLKAYLDSSSRGVVYVSLGTNVHPSLMDKDLKDTFVNALEALPFDVLWKFDSDHLETTPKNAKIQKWFPQRDLLMHPNIKVFVTQGGLQSTDEAIDAAVPLVGIPMLGDQWFNVNKYVELGIGVEVDVLTMGADDIVNSVKVVAGNDSYRENIKRLRSIVNDQPQRPLERAVWWTEHVLRHGGARHLRAPAANMSWSEYLMMDVLVTVVLALLTLVFTMSLLLYYIIRIVLRKKLNKSKVKLS